MKLARQSAGVVRTQVSIAAFNPNDGILPSDCNCNYDCRVCKRVLGRRICWDDPTCQARAAVCRASCASCQDKCDGWNAAALAACAVAGPGYPACADAANLAWIACRAQC